eukprot:151890_1
MSGNIEEDERGTLIHQVEIRNKSGNNPNESSRVLETKATKQWWGRGSSGKGGMSLMAQEVEENLGNGDVGAIRHHMHLGLDRPIEGCALIPRWVWMLYGRTDGVVLMEGYIEFVGGV